MSLLQTLSKQGLLRPASAPRAIPDVDSPLTLLRLCAEGLLEGGLAVALDVRPDELLGPLCAAVGGRAQSIKVDDVRDSPPEMALSLGAATRMIEVPNVQALVDALNDWLAGDPQARWIAVLGEIEDALALLCVPKSKLPALRRLRAFAPENG